MFINTFWKNSRPFNSGGLDDFLQFIARSAPQQLGYRLEREPNTRDVYLIEVFTKLSTDWKVIAKSIQHYLESSNIDFTGKNYSRLLEIAAECTLLECNDDVKNLFNYLYEEKYFELLVSFLNISSEDETSVTNYLEFTLKPNLNAVGQPYTEGRSLLFNALRKKIDGTIYRTAAIRILQSRANTEKVYVHWDGLSCTVVAFAKSERLPGFSGDENESTMLDELDKDLMDLINNASAHDVSTQSDSKIKIVKEKFRRRVTNPQYNNKSWTDLAEEISCYKFTAWSEEINGFARDIYKAKQWEVLVALMNAFIPEHQDSNYVIRACDLTAADLTAAVCPKQRLEQLGLNSLLYYAFSKREYQPFAFTAAATILTLTRGLPKSVVSFGDSPHYFVELGDFVNQYSGLMFQQKQKLLELIRDNASIISP